MEESGNGLSGNGKGDGNIWKDNQHWGTGWRNGGGVNGKNRGSAKVSGGGYLQPIPGSKKETGVLPIPGSEKEGDNKKILVLF
ncbi:hypothetical protein TSUD_123180 [Trifolium subterraneum]|uniref:Uncharacterized protein n=1 Tax=Trifolium subterraneum TaxID=3900 RepID=A0A2Z6LT14_TRISU|nr:hypothetical protein TSUD_123180 [Trifolium subterraneum]